MSTEKLDSGKDWRQKLMDVGSYENGMTAVPAAGVREIVEDVEALRAELAAYKQAAKELEEKHHEVGEIEARAAEILAAKAGAKAP